MISTRNLLFWTLICAMVGCSDSAETQPTARDTLSPQQISRQGDLNFVQDAATGYQLAVQHQRPCLLFFTAEWCTFCHKMEDTAFADRIVANLANNFVCVLVDADREAEVCRQFGVKGYPTVLFISAEGRQLHRLVGLQTAGELARGMQTALERFAWLNTPDKRRR